MSDLQPPDAALPELRTTAQVNLRSEPHVKASREAYLEQDVLVWEEGREDGWVEVWLHGWVHGDFVRAV